MASRSRSKQTVYLPHHGHADTVVLRNPMKLLRVLETQVRLHTRSINNQETDEAVDKFDGA